MSKAKRKQEAMARSGASTRFVAALVLGVLVLAGVLVAAVTIGGKNGPAAPADDPRLAALASEHAATLGDPDAKVHIVEFLDPACGTCAVFYPMVKQWLKEAPGKLRLTVRHVPFHTGVDYVVRVLEASREQDKYWETLEALLMSQRQWVTNHVVQPDRVLPAIAAVGLDEERLIADMDSPAVVARMQKDQEDAVTLRVSATPEYFVNGRPLPSFGQQQLLDLVREELEKHY